MGLCQQLQVGPKSSSAVVRRRFNNKAHYSLDADDGIEKDILFVSLSLWEIYERKMTTEQLQAK